MKPILKKFGRVVRAVGMLLVRVVVELVRDAVAYAKRRGHVPWPDGSTATTL